MQIEQARQLRPLSQSETEAPLKRQRVYIFLMDHPQEKRFGYWRSPKDPTGPMPIPKTAGPRTPAHISALKEMELFAGLAAARNPRFCWLCQAGRNHKAFRLSEWDYVFRPLPDGPAYRWPCSLMHLLEEHKVDSPALLPVLVQEFNKARGMGLWQK